MELGLVIPGGLPGPSGGSIYNDQLAAALGEAGHRVTMTPIRGDWPNGSPADHQKLAEALGKTSGKTDAPVLVDGLMASAAPEAIRAAVDAGGTVWVLLHLPLPAETGLTDQEMKAFAASEEAALRHASGVICTSQWARDDLIRRYGLEQVHVVPPGTEPAAVAAGSAPPHLVMLGSLTPRKNHSMVLSALADLADLPWTASLVGGASPQGSTHVAMLHDQAAAFEPGRITIPGVLQGPALDAEWARSDLLLLPSLAETFGMVVTEGLARGIPGVVGRGTGAVEALTGGTAGQLPGAVVDPHDPQELAATLRDWLTDSSLRQSWRAAALSRRDTLPTWANTATTLLEIIHP
ncbi:glycosyltransferase family 4 protein [Arthrobacter sp. TMT4-20]